jgi:hypothetical protein
MLTKGVIALHDSAPCRPHCPGHTAVHALECGGSFSIHSLYLSPCDFHVFGSLKKVPNGRRFSLDEDVKAAVVKWFQKQPREFFVDGDHRLVPQCDACFNTHGDYF